MTVIATVAFDEIDQFLEELNPILMRQPIVRLSAAPMPDHPSMPGGQWLVRLGALYEDVLLQVTVPMDGEATAEQRVKKLEKELDKLGLELRQGSRYEVG